MQRKSETDGHMPSNHLSSSPTVLPISVAGSPAHVPRHARRLSHLRYIVGGIDWLLRRFEGMFEFSRSETCLLRIALTRTNATVRLPDGVMLARGTPIAALHLWNEHLPSPPAKGPSFAWVNRIRRQMLWSLKELALYARTSPDMQNVVAFQARIAFASRAQHDKMLRIAATFGFERIEPDASPPLGRRIHDVLENFWLWALVWTFNPRGLRHRSLKRQRHALWISKAALIKRFGFRPTRRSPTTGIAKAGMDEASSRDSPLRFPESDRLRRSF